jgi:retinol dehydrogenase-12
VNNFIKGKSVVVTGATSGIGFQSALDLAANGAFVIGVGRNPGKCEDAKSKIQNSVPGAKIEILCADLSIQKQIQGLSVQIKTALENAGFNWLDVLVNNAGVYMGKRVLTVDGVETTFAVNHIAAFLLTHKLLPLLSRTENSRVITVGSNSHYKTKFNPERAKNPAIYFGLWAYKVSKLANILFSNELNSIQAERPPHAFVVDPGLVNTDIGLKDTGSLARTVWHSRQKLGAAPEIPVKTILYLAGEPSIQHATEIYWRDCKPKQPSREAMDQNLAKHLWDESCRICGLPVQ